MEVAGTMMFLSLFLLNWFLITSNFPLLLNNQQLCLKSNIIEENFNFFFSLKLF